MIETTSNVQELSNIISLEDWRESTAKSEGPAQELVMRARDLLETLVNPNLELSSEILEKSKKVIQSLVGELRKDNENLLGDQLERDLANLDLYWRKLKATEALVKHTMRE